MERLRIGIIGFGRIGAEHANWISSSPSARVSAVFDPTPARRAIAESRALRAFDNIEPLLESADALLISTPTSMHFDHALRALAANRHVMIEKPMALDLPQARRLIDEASKRSLTLSVFHNRRWDPDYLALAQAIRAGTFGRLLNVESRIGQWASCVGPAAREWRPNWRNEAAFGGGGLYDWGSHFLDQLLLLLLPARPVRLFAQLRGNVWSADCDDLARVCIDFDNGTAALVEINTTTTRPLPRWHIDGALGSADSPFSLTFDLQTWADLTFTPADGSPPRKLPPAPPGLSETDIWDRFARAVLHDAEPAVAAESVLPTMALLDAARRSAREGRAIPL